jgi:hypothetical protein
MRAAPAIGAGGVYAGPFDEGEKALAPLRGFGKPTVDLFQPIPYNQAQRMTDFLWPPGLHGYWKSSYMENLSDAAIGVIVDYFSRVPSPRTVVVLEHNGDGAIECPNRQRPLATALGLTTFW